jgi:hypothetical protein
MKSLILFAGLAMVAHMAYATQITFQITFSSSSSTTIADLDGFPAFGVATEQYTPSQINSHWTSTLFAGSSSSWISLDPASEFGCAHSSTQTVDKSSTGFCSVTTGDTVTFRDTFNISSLSGTYTLYVLADDSATVTVDGHSVATAGSLDCTTTPDTAINCVTVSTFNVTSDLTPGSNTLLFTVRQSLSDSEFGLNFDLVETPEPGSLTLLGLGLLGIGLLGRLRRHNG